MLKLTVHTRDVHAEALLSQLCLTQASPNFSCVVCALYKSLLVVAEQSEAMP